MSFIFVVDSGGSKTKAAFFDQDGGKSGEVSGGPSALSLGVDNAANVIEGLFGYAVGLSGIRAANESVTLIIGISGFEIKGLAGELDAKLKHMGTCHILSDAELALYAAFQGAPGIVLTMGTGSIAWSLDANGQTRRAGGYGFAISDLGSGAWIGHHVIRDFVADLDKLTPGDRFSQKLASRLKDDFGLTSEALIQFGQTASPGDFAKFTPLVFELAQQGDAYCDALLKTALGHGCSLVTAVNGEGQNMPLALNGSVAKALKSHFPDDPVFSRAIDTDIDPLTGGIHYLSKKA